MRCATCSTDNPDDRTFCGNCGQRLGNNCARCGAPNSAEQRYCGSCGASLSGLVDSKTIAAPAAIAAAGRSAALPEWIGGRRYRILRLLGEGGSKIVYLGHDRKLDRDVAISTFRIEGLDQAGRERVAREARAMGRLEDHPHIVLVYDFGEENELPYLVSQYATAGQEPAGNARAHVAVTVGVVAVAVG
jgi:hypothetical protein